jgi:arsenate reductase
LPFVDPKSSDDSNVQDETYLKTNEQIAAEIYYMFSKIKETLT